MYLTNRAPNSSNAFNLAKCVLLACSACRAHGSANLGKVREVLGVTDADEATLDRVLAALEVVGVVDRRGEVLYFAPELDASLLHIAGASSAVNKDSDGGSDSDSDSSSDSDPTRDVLRGVLWHLCQNLSAVDHVSVQDLVAELLPSGLSAEQVEQRILPAVRDMIDAVVATGLIALACQGTDVYRVVTKWRRLRDRDILDTSHDQGAPFELTSKMLRLFAPVGLSQTVVSFAELKAALDCSRLVLHCLISTLHVLQIVQPMYVDHAGTQTLAPIVGVSVTFCGQGLLPEALREIQQSSASDCPATEYCFRIAWHTVRSLLEQQGQNQQQSSSSLAQLAEALYPHACPEKTDLGKRRLQRTLAQVLEVLQAAGVVQSHHSDEGPMYEITGSSTLTGPPPNPLPVPLEAGALTDSATLRFSITSGERSQESGHLAKRLLPPKSSGERVSKVAKFSFSELGLQRESSSAKEPANDVSMTYLASASSAAKGGNPILQLTKRSAARAMAAPNVPSFDAVAASSSASENLEETAPVGAEALAEGPSTPVHQPGYVRQTYLSHPLPPPDPIFLDEHPDAALLALATLGTQSTPMPTKRPPPTPQDMLRYQVRALREFMSAYTGFYTRAVAKRLNIQ